MELVNCLSDQPNKEEKMKELNYSGLAIVSSVLVLEQSLNSETLHDLYGTRQFHLTSRCMAGPLFYQTAQTPPLPFPTTDLLSQKMPFFTKSEKKGIVCARVDLSFMVCPVGSS